MGRLTPNERRELIKSSVQTALADDWKRANDEVDFDEIDETLHWAFNLEFLENLEVGAITPEERSEFIRHLGECPLCAERIALQMKVGGLFADKEAVDEPTAAAPIKSESDLTPTVLKSKPTAEKLAQTSETLLCRARRRRFSGWGIATTAAVVAFAFVGTYKLATTALRAPDGQVAMVVQSSDVEPSNAATATATDGAGSSRGLSTGGEPGENFAVIVGLDDYDDGKEKSPSSKGFPRSKGFRNIGEVATPEEEKRPARKRKEELERARRKIEELRRGANDDFASEFSAKLTDLGFGLDGEKENANGARKFDAETFDKIVVAYEDALEIEPSDNELRLEYAWFLVENGGENERNLRRAETLLTTASTKADEKETALGVCAFMRGDLVSAKKRFKRALALNSRNEAARTNLAISDVLERKRETSSDGDATAPTPGASRF